MSTTPITQASGTLRSEFERWYGEGFKRAVERNSDGTYKYADTNHAWEVWKAAVRAVQMSTQDYAAIHFAATVAAKLLATTMAESYEARLVEANRLGLLQAKHFVEQIAAIAAATKGQA